MSVYSMIQTLGSNSMGILGILVLVGSMVEVAPIKINPVQSFGKLLTGHIDKRLDKLEYQVNKAQAEQWIVQVLRFADEIAIGTVHSKEHYDDIIQRIAEYSAFCRDHPEFINNRIPIAEEAIEKEYKCRFYNVGC